MVIPALAITGGRGSAIAVSANGRHVYVTAEAADGSSVVNEFMVGTGGALSLAGLASASAQPGGIVADGVQTNLTASHFAPLTVTLTAGALNTSLAGQTLTFTAGGQSCTTVTNMQTPPLDEILPPPLCTGCQPK
jgi:hypothetical protein